MIRPLIIGIGEAGFESLAPELQQRVADAEIVIAAPRFHAQLPTSPKVMGWPSPFSDIHSLIEKNAGRKLVLLATGDPMWFGAGASIARRLGRDGCEVIPAPSGLQLAASRLGWPLAECGIVSIHGRPAHTILSRLHPRAKLLVIPRDGKSPGEAADLLTSHGHGKARIHVLANLGSKENHTSNRRPTNGPVQIMQRARVTSPTSTSWPSNAPMRMSLPQTSPPRTTRSRMTARSPDAMSARQRSQSSRLSQAPCSGT